MSSSRQVKHSANCIDPRFISLDALATLIADEFDVSIPGDIDYEIAEKVKAYILTCSNAGLARQLSAEGKGTHEIAEEMELSDNAVRRLLAVPEL